MALSLQRELEVAGELARVQPLLLRLHLIEKPKKRRPERDLILAGGTIVVGTVVAAVVVGRGRCKTSTPDDIQGFAQTSVDAEPPETAFGLEGAEPPSGHEPE